MKTWVRNKQFKRRTNWRYQGWKYNSQSKDLIWWVWWSSEHSWKCSGDWIVKTASGVRDGKKKGRGGENTCVQTVENSLKIREKMNGGETNSQGVHSQVYQIWEFLPQQALWKHSWRRLTNKKSNKLEKVLQAMKRKDEWISKVYCCLNKNLP